MVSLDDYKDVRSCLYKEREYLVRDNGCVFRKSNKNKKGVLDDKWTFGRKDSRSGYMLIGSERVHRIVATAFHGEPSDKELVQTELIIDQKILDGLQNWKMHLVILLLGQR